jgi:hypothetical protein
LYFFLFLPIGLVEKGQQRCLAKINHLLLRIVRILFLRLAALRLAAIEQTVANTPTDDLTTQFLFIIMDL